MEGKRAVGFLLIPLLVLAGERPKVPPLHHVVDIVVPGEMEVKPPLRLGPSRKLKCPVCHGIERIDQIPFEEVDKEDPRFLRGGPYERLTDFCFLCHEKKSHERPNIHAQMVDERGEIREEVCLYCHEQLLDRERHYELSQVQLRAPVGTICFGCHLKTPHLNALEHQVEPSDRVKRRRAKFLQDHPEVTLPLTPDGKVTCITCHTPHPPGVISERLPAGRQVKTAGVEEAPVYRESPWAVTVQRDKEERLAKLSREVGRPFRYRYRQIAGEALLRLPAKDGTLCRACHEFPD